MNADLVWALTQIGFYASFNGLPQEGVRIFEGLDAVYDDNVGIKNGLGMSYVLSGENKKAVKVYREHVLISEPQNYDARCFLGMALWEEGSKEESKKLLEDAYKNGGENAKVISESCLEAMAAEK